MVRIFESLAAFGESVGETLGTSEWLKVDQDVINTFAQATGDHQWIHVDDEKAKSGPFGMTVAHGYLTLSLIPVLSMQIYEIQGLSLGVNYGANKVRFPAPVTVGTRIRATAELVDLVEIGLGMQATIRFVVEGDRGDKPACVAEVLYVYADAATQARKVEAHVG